MLPPDKVAVVTGASSGIGEAIARRLASEGLTVMAVARRADRLQVLERRDGRIVPHPADVTRRTDVAALADRVAREFGRCDVLVNSAGVPGSAFTGPDDLDDVVRTMQVNFMGGANCMAVLHDLLAASAPSHVINVASVAGKVGVGPAGYVASKRPRERTVPRWYRPVVVLRHLLPALYWRGIARVPRARGTR